MRELLLAGEGEPVGEGGQELAELEGARCRLRSAGGPGRPGSSARPFIVDLTVLVMHGAVRWPGRDARGAAEDCGHRGGAWRRPVPFPAAGHGFAPSVAGGARVLLVAAGGRGWPAGEDVVQQADGLVLLGAFAVQGGLVAGELVAQPGDGVVRRRPAARWRRRGRRRAAADPARGCGQRPCGLPRLRPGRPHARRGRL